MNQVIDQPDPDAVDAIPVESGPGRMIGIVVAWLAVLGIAGLALWLFWSNVVEASGSSAVESYIEGDAGEIYSSARDGFRVELPSTPSRREVPGPDGPVVVVDSQPGSGYSFSVTRVPQTETALENYTAALDTAAGSLAADVNGEIISQTEPVRFGAVTLKDVVFRTGTRWYRSRLVLAADRLYTVQAMTESRDPAAFERLWDSFEILETG